MFTEEALQYLHASHNEPRVILDEPTRLIIALGSQLLKIEKQLPSRNHQFSTLAGFLEYMNSWHAADDKGVVFVNGSNVVADLQYQKPGSHRAILRLEHSEEFNALNALFKGVSQKELWRLLMTKLHGCLSDTLLFEISSLKISGGDTVTSQIQKSGLANGESKRVMKIQNVDPKVGVGDFELSLEWTWTGRIWECYDTEYEIELHLELAFDGPKFTFHPRRLDKVLNQAKQDLVGTLQGNLSANQFTVHEGTL